MSSLTPPDLQLGEDPEEVWGTLCSACGHVSGIHTREGCGLVGCDCIRHAGQTNEPARIVNGVLDVAYEHAVCGIEPEPSKAKCTCHRHSHEYNPELFFCAWGGCYCRVVPE